MRRGLGQSLRDMAVRSALWRRLGAALERVLQLHDSPHSIARGVAIGLFIALTPTVGVQMILVLIIHTLVRANRLAGIAMVWISNPFTVVPIYWTDYQVGRLLLGSEAIAYERFAQLFDLTTTGFIARFLEFAGNLKPVLVDVAVPMCLGGALLGALVAIPSYPVTVWLVRRERDRRGRRERLRRLRSEHGAARTGEQAEGAEQALAVEVVRRADEPLAV